MQSGGSCWTTNRSLRVFRGGYTLLQVFISIYHEVKNRHLYILFPSVFFFFLIEKNLEFVPTCFYYRSVVEGCLAHLKQRPAVFCFITQKVSHHSFSCVQSTLKLILSRVFHLLQLKWSFSYHISPFAICA